MGDAVYAMLGYGRDGAAAEYAIVLPSELAPRPHTLDDIQAAAVPLSALTAWQALFVHGGLSAGQTALIHGAEAAWACWQPNWRLEGARVLTTASARHADFVRALGADEVIDYATTRFEDVVHDVDVVFDTVGGDTLARSWQVVKPGGAFVSVVSRLNGQPVRGHPLLYFIVEPSGAQLREIGALIDAGQIHPVVDQAFPLDQARQAMRRQRVGIHAARSSLPWGDLDGGSRFRWPWMAP